MREGLLFRRGEHAAAGEEEDIVEAEAQTCRSLPLISELSGSVKLQAIFRGSRYQACTSAPASGSNRCPTEQDMLASEML